jgi:hypothetical protein
MACCNPITSDDAGQQGLDIAAKMQQHEALTREIYGCSLDEFLAIAIDRGHSLGFRKGCAAGYRGGRVDGYRAAKGRKKSSKITAKTVIALTVERIGWGADPKLLEQTATQVLECIAIGTAELSDQKVPKDVTTVLKTQGRNRRAAGWPQPTTLLSEYSRQRAKALRTQ